MAPKDRKDPAKTGGAPIQAAVVPAAAAAGATAATIHLKFCSECKGGLEADAAPTATRCRACNRLESRIQRLFKNEPDRKTMFQDLSKVSVSMTCRAN